MDRRGFLKRLFAALVLTESVLSIDDCNAIPQAKKDKIEPGETQARGSPGHRMSIAATGRMTCGGNLFNGYAHGRDSLDTADLRLQTARLSQTIFLAGWRPDSDLGSQELLWKGAY